MGQKKTRKKLRDANRSLSSRKTQLRRLLDSAYGVKRTELLYELVRDDRLDDELRQNLIFDISQVTAPGSVRALREIVHGRRHNDALRSQALYNLALLNDPPFHVDAMSLLGDPGETHVMRAETASEIGALHIRRAMPLITRVLQDTSEHPLVLFWCLYACNSFEPDDELMAIVTLYSRDDREVEPGMKGTQKSKATLAMEAAWVLEKWRGLITDPRWMHPEEE